MFNSSECVIEFKNSYVYRRLILIFNLVAIFLISDCDLPFGLILGLNVGMLIFSVQVYLNPKPYSKLGLLSMRSGAHHLAYKNGIIEHYTHCNVLIHCGLFFLLKLSNHETQCTFVIFFDQIEADCYRTICFLEKIQ